MESRGAAVDDGGVSSSQPATRATPRRRFRAAVVAASVALAIVGSVLLATHRSDEQVNPRTGALPAGGKVVAAIHIGHGVRPPMGGGAMAVGEGAVWAMSDAARTLSRIDPARNAVVAKIEAAPPDSVAAGDGAVWLTYPFDNVVSRVDPATNRVVANIPVGPRPEGIAVAPGAVWVATADGPSLARIDPATNRVVATIRLGSRRECCADHMSVAASPRAVWVAVTNGNRIVRVDPGANSVVETVPIDYGPCGFLVTDKTGLWSSGACGGDVVTRLDVRTKKVTARVSEVHPVGLGVAFGSAWVAVTGTGNVDRIDQPTGRLAARLHVSGLIVRLGVGFGSIWVNDDFGRILRIDPTP
jgi:YVTN family beta-propeller protein